MITNKNEWFVAVMALIKLIFAATRAKGRQYIGLMSLDYPLVKPRSEEH
jgi:hypothetical protein